MEPILKTINLTKVYGAQDINTQVVALKDVNCQFEAGTFTAITGRSGSGKTTLLKLLGALIQPSGGRVELEGMDISDLDDDLRATVRRERIGFVFQSFNLIPELTAYENIVLPLYYSKIKPNKKAIDSLAEQFGIADRLNHHSYELSGGQQQRVAIVRALAIDPAIILADEPTGNLDVESGKTVISFLKSVCQSYGKTVIMVTHDKAAAMEADRIITLEDGKIISAS